MPNPETAKATSGQSGYRGRISVVWSDGAFRWYWLSICTQSLALGMQFLVIGWLVLEITGSSTQLGLVVSLYGIPNVSFVLVAGSEPGSRRRGKFVDNPWTWGESKGP